MKGLLAIYRKEFASYFTSWMGWIVLAAFLGFMGFFFFKTMLEDKLADMRGFFSWLPMIFLFFGPAVAMKLIAEEKKIGAFEILLTLPLSDWQVVLGKYLAAVSYIGVALLCTWPMPITVHLVGAVDMGAVWSGYIGSFLLGAAFVAIGLFASSLVKDQVLAFILGLLLSFLLFIAGVPHISSYFPEWLVFYLNKVSLLYHFNSLGRGVVDTRDVAYFAGTIMFFLFSSIVSLESRKW
jgi:ABC-2 type transport system permease protein